MEHISSKARMTTIFLIMLPAILLSLLTISESATMASHDDSQAACQNQQNKPLISELQGLKLKIDRLEAKLEESIQKINAKSLYLEDCEKLIGEMERKIHSLQSVLLGIKGDSLRVNERLNALEEEVRLLWAASRKNNFDLHLLKSKVQDSEDRLEAVNSQVEKMDDIVTEHWIHIRHLEHAIQSAEMRALKAQMLEGSTRSTLLKFINIFTGNHVRKAIMILDPFSFDKRSTSSSHESQILHQLKRILSGAKKYHHQIPQQEVLLFLSSTTYKHVLHTCTPLGVFPHAGCIQKVEFPIDVVLGWKRS